MVEMMVERGVDIHGRRDAVVAVMVTVVTVMAVVGGCSRIHVHHHRGRGGRGGGGRHGVAGEEVVHLAAVVVTVGTVTVVGSDSRH